MLIVDGWTLVRTEGSHNLFKHTKKKGTICVPHPRKDLPVKTVMSILDHAEIKHD